MTDQQKVAIVTGAGLGIGKAIAARLARDGFAVGINDINKDNANAAAAEIEAAGGSACVAVADVSNRQQVQQMVDTVVEKFGRLDVMVSNAGIITIDPIAALTEEGYDRIFSINVKGVIWCAQAASKQMIAQGEGGRIINAGSDAAHFSSALGGAYASTKFAVRSLTQSMAKEWAQHGITVNSYCPGVVDTDMWDIIDERASELMGIPRGSMKQNALAGIPLGRLQTPDDVANLVSFFASDDADYITGQNILTNGGTVMI